MNALLPLLSAILIIGNQRERARLMLKSVLAQSLIDQMEVLLLDCGAPGAAPVPGSDYPRVRTIRLNPGLSAGWVRAEGIRLARAPIVVFLEEHAWALPGWAEAIVQAHDGPWVAVGPEMNNGNPWVGINEVLALTYYPLWSPPAKHGEIGAIAHHNTSYKRSIVLAYSGILETLMFPEGLLHLRLQADGYRLFLESRMKVLHFFESRLNASWKINFLAERAVEAGRDAVFRRPFWKRILRFVALPFMPLVRTVRLFRMLARERRNRLDLFFHGLPIILIVNIACAVGAAAGLLLGMGDTPRQFLDAQINLDRTMPSELMLKATLK